MIPFLLRYKHIKYIVIMSKAHESILDKWHYSATTHDIILPWKLELVSFIQKFGFRQRMLMNILQFWN